VYEDLAMFLINVISNIIYTNASLAGLLKVMGRKDSYRKFELLLLHLMNSVFKKGTLS
jgi:HD-like signal output (HDOD) protein